MPEQEYKSLAELRVTELKMELEKRSLDKNGIKIILSDRLEKAIRAEGYDPATYKFCVSDNMTPVKSKSSACSTPAPTEKSESVEPASEEPKSEAPVVEPAAKADELSVATEEKEVVTSAAATTESSPTAVTPAADSSSEETKKTAAEEKKEAEEPMDTNEAPSKEEEQQLDDPLDDKSEPAKTSASDSAESVEKKDDRDATNRSFWVRGLGAATKAADLREYFATYGKVARAKIFTSKKEPGKTFGLVTMADSETVELCCTGANGKEWNGVKITVEKGNHTIQTAARTSAASNVGVKKPEPIQPPPKEEKKSSETKKEEDKKTATRARIEAAVPVSRSRERERPRDNRDRRPADRIAPSSVKIHREPIRSSDSRRTISAARISSSRPNPPPRSSGGIRAPASMAGRLSRPVPSASSGSSRRQESYSGRRPDNSEVQRMREELRLREADRQLEREREKLRMERERIEREKLELQVLQQQQQLATLKANLEGTRNGRGDSRGHGHSASSSRDKYTSSSSRSAPEPRSHEKNSSRPSRPDDRRAHIGQGDRSRSRHDSRSHHDEGRSRHESHSRHEPRHEPRHDTRHEGRQEPSRHVPASYGGSSRNHSSYSSREAPPLIPGQNHYGSRDSYASGLSSRDFDASRGTTSGSNWGQASWAGLPTAGDGWGVRGGGNAGGSDWSSSAYGSGGGGAGSSTSNIRIDYDKYRRQY